MAASEALSAAQVAEAEQRIRNTGRISMIDMQVSLGILIGFAFLSCAGRMIIRLQTRRRLFLDDAFILAALVSLGASTGIIYRTAPNNYLVQAIIRDDPVAVQIATPRLKELGQHMNWVDSVNDSAIFPSGRNV